MKTTIGPHVLTAMRAGHPLVALETALITHGLPYPLNLETILRMEAAVREFGAIPATIGVLLGEVVIGLTEEELAALAKAEAPIKMGVRELPVASLGKLSGGTTVSATAYLAHRYGLAVLATGGIGGVHRGACSSFDISADLTVLSRTPITVISSGAKAFLDLGLTLEYLETQGVTVAGYGTNIFPAFYAATSPYRLALRFDSPKEVAKVALARDELGLDSALLINNPVLAAQEIPWEELITYIVQIEGEIKSAGIVGQDVTPQMLRRLIAVTSGRSLKANLALLTENARLGAEIALAICAERKRANG
ncbi:MAG: pseudouridine-5'-phosphate glycosidase [Dethiobacter sp.]|nr:pseudouridine-5'-phosphate glycosidase [Dethiobacter sp.]MBS3900054.1 pseudouridine-5'-phosphate glycosidase [Dethiobacter sp.]